MIKLLLLCLLLAGCATSRVPAPARTFHVHLTTEGVTALVDALTGESIGYSFHVGEIYTNVTPTEGE